MTERYWEPETNPFVPEPAPRRLFARKPVPPGIPGKDRPRLIKDEGPFRRLFRRVTLLVVAAAGAWLAVRFYAGLYHVLTGLNAAQHDAYHAVFPVEWFRHLIVRDANEKVYAGATLQILVYYFASKWPRKAPNRWDQIEKHLGIVNQRLDDQGLIPLLLAPFWLLVYALPGELAVAGILFATHSNTNEPATWQISIAGFTGSFIFGRRIAKGFAYHVQRLMIRERLEKLAYRNERRVARDKKPRSMNRPSWWMLWPLRWRLEWIVQQGTGWMHRDRPWDHRRLQLALHGVTYLAIVAGVVYLTWRGQQLISTTGI
jgi:hypothetical protein